MPSSKANHVPRDITSHEPFTPEEREAVRLSQQGPVSWSLPEPEFTRASGQSICPACGERYLAHPHADEYPGYDGRPFLRRLCDGRLVKL
jgi:hypothetical protein